jgi:hypothetical protein
MDDKITIGRLIKQFGYDDTTIMHTAKRQATTLKLETIVSEILK